MAIITAAMKNCLSLQHATEAGLGMFVAGTRRNVNTDPADPTIISLQDRQQSKGVTFRMPTISNREGLEQHLKVHTWHELLSFYFLRDRHCMRRVKESRHVRSFTDLARDSESPLQAASTHQHQTACSSCTHDFHDIDFLLDQTISQQIVFHTV